MKAFLQFLKTLFFKPTLALSILFLLSASSSWGQIAQRGTATTGTSSSASVTVARPTGVVQGDIMIANIANYCDGCTQTSAVLSGWSLIAGTDIERGRASLLWKIATRSEPTSYTFTVTSSSTRAVGGIVAFSGVNNSTPFDVTASTSWTTATNANITNIPSITTLTANTAVLLFGAAARVNSTTNANYNGSNWTMTSPATLTELFDVGNNANNTACIGAAWATKPTTGATGAGRVNCVVNTSPRLMAGIALVLRPAPAPCETVTSASATPTLRLNSALTNITHSTTGATGIGTATGLPAGVSASWASNTITISGTPTAEGVFNYSIPLTGGCGTVNATGTITVVTYKSEIISANLGSTTWCAGETRQISVTIKNVGTATWADGAIGNEDINIGVKWNTNGVNWTDYHVRTDAKGLAPGETGTFNFTLTAANNPGSGYTDNLAAGTNNITFDLVYEGIFWFANNGSGNTVFTSPVQTINTFFTTTSQTFNATGTYTVPAGVTQLTVQAWGGGGAGGGTRNAGSNNANGGGGGGGGAYATNVINVTPGQVLSIQVGAGGTGVEGGNGNNGGNSTITGYSSEILAEGGKGGSSAIATSGNLPVSGGSAGLAGNSIGTTKTNGIIGGNGTRGNGINSGAGGAAASPNGGAGGAVQSGSGNTNNGNSGSAPGGGGGGSRTSENEGSRTGGAGGAGRIIVTATNSIGITANQTICVGSNATITASGATSYVWNNSLGTASSVTVSPSATTTYTVTGTAANGCTSIPTSTTVYVKQQGSWIGAVSTEWNNSGNWCGTIPTASTDVTIPNEPSNKPIIGSANAVVRSLIIESGAQLTINSNRNLEVWGNWTNNGTFTANSGSVNFKQAGGVQAIGGANVSTFNNISIEGGGEKAISKDVEINGAVTFTSGYITSVNSSKLIFRAGSSVASAAGAAKDASFAKVQVVKFGTTAFEFPVGGLVNSVNKYRPIGISNFLGTSPTDFFTAEHVASNPLNNLQYNTVLGSTIIYKTETLISETLTSISNFEYWNLSRSNASSVVNVTMDWSVYPTSNANAQFLRMGHYDATPSNRFWENAPNASGVRSFDFATKKLTVTNVNSFSPFAIASIQAAALPVTLASFTAKPTPDNKVSLAWVTSTEQVNKGFRIERQAGNDNGKFEQIGFVGSKAKDGNSQSTLTYNFIDAAPKVGAASFYRLVQEDLDGKLTYSEVRVVKLNGQSVSMVFPNPSNGAVNISRTADGRKMNIQVIDQSGRIVSQVNNITDANYRINISQSGVYSIKMMYPETGEQSTQRVVVQK